MSKSFEYHLSPPLPDDHPEVLAQKAKNDKFASKLGWSGLLEDDEGDFLQGKTCNPDNPEECESCQ